MSKTRNLSDLLDANGDVKLDALDNAPSPTLTGIDDNADATAITIDSNENVLVGKTSTDLGTAGQALLSNGVSFFTRDGDKVLRVNRLTSDGDIIDLLKDGTTVGSIGSAGSGGDLYISSSAGAGIYFGGGSGSGSVAPTTDGSTRVDNVVDLGNSSFRWNDLWMGGSVYLGGTGSANALDDYEEGTWTPTFGGAGSDPSSVSWNIQSGTYTKVGNQVFARAIVYPSSFSGGSGNWNVRSLPFTANANSVGTMMWDRIRIQASYPGGLVPRVLNNTTYMEFPEMNDWIDEASNRIQVDDLASNFYLELSIVYTTNS